MDDKPKVIAFFLDAEIADDDPHREVKLRALDVDAAAEVLGQAARKTEAGVRADAVGGLVAALAVESLDVMEVCDASGLPEAGIDAATYLAVELEKVERRYPDD